ncbi:indole-3-glycerol phosphate synthase [Fistulifera solaris]|uniref:indole-3-glycerol-phosphate synthase n=1 Tax=Fistulifera solaris TaxID=1519565 RepID=A0A1Z5JAD8_FISSO|nr:indole-3-glycerol phosphate synthase [Fistulifera solaris]|eukprot:GAX10963.1 indole-3-glycerol phosphate synthase [Fistulifera solaris]
MLRPWASLLLLMSTSFVPQTRAFTLLYTALPHRYHKHVNPYHHASRQQFNRYLSVDAFATEYMDLNQPMAMSTGHSSHSNLVEALQEAVTMALRSLPIATEDQPLKVDLAMVSVSSLYDGGTQQPSTLTVPTILAAASAYNVQIQNLIGSSVAGCIGSAPAVQTADQPNIIIQACDTVEYEGIPAVIITMAIFPDTTVRTFHLEDLPDDDMVQLDATEWKKEVGLLPRSAAAEDTLDQLPTSFLLVPSPAFSTQVDALLLGLETYFPQCTIVGGIASTVSSLSRAKLYQWSAHSSNPTFHTNGCIGVILQGDVQIQTMTAQGAKAVGGIYQILKGEDSTINAIVLDEAATEALKDAEESAEEEDDEDDEVDEKDMDVKARQAQAYAKARIPKPVLAEANFLMRTLSDDDQAFMRRTLLIGLEQQQGPMTARTVSELLRLAEGQGHRFTVHQVATAGMKDGSVTLPLGKVNITPGNRMRFFVRESEFAKKEIEALWIGYKKRLLGEQFAAEEDKPKVKFEAAGCLIIPTLDRGSKFFQGKQYYESSTAARMLPSVSCISGFFSNGVLLSGTTIQGSATGYFLFGSYSGRAIYNPIDAKKESSNTKESSDDENDGDDAATKIGPQTLASKAPRGEDGELILKRREIHSGRALTVSTVEWSVAEKTAVASSALEEFMWEKETEVDRFRERVPLANLVSQCRLSATDPTMPKPRDFVASLKSAAQNDQFIIIPEFKKSDPVGGSLRRRYDLAKLSRTFVQAGAPAMAVNCDPIFFGGSLSDIQTVREETAKAALDMMSEDGVVVPPVLAMDLILYPYQLYKLRLAGADAISLIAGALAAKDLLYLSKIAASLQFQVFVKVTSEVQMRAVMTLEKGSIHGLIFSNRLLEDYMYDLTGAQALSLLKSDTFEELKERHGDIQFLVQGRVGLIGDDATDYVKQIKEAGATGAIVGSCLADKDAIVTMETLRNV